MVAGSNRRDQGRERQIDRVVPRRDDADDAKRHEAHFCLGRPELPSGFPLLRPDPALEFRQRVIDLGKHDAALAQQRFMPGAMAEIRIDRFAHLVLAGAQPILEPAQVVTSLLGGWTLFQPCAAQPVQGGAKLRG
ncbi:hypothetical protein D9M70_439280 [compost metagenome]